MKSLFRSLAHYLIRPLIQVYLIRERSYKYKNIQVKILPGVFHPGLFFSTGLLLEYIASFDLKEKTFLELGAGTGLISFYAETKEARVTATDLSSRAIQNLEINKSSLHSGITILKSDLFDQIPLQPFDFIIINPPYYPKKPISEDQLAWYCGEHFEYFEKLFSSLAPFIHSLSNILLVVSEDCNIMQIGDIASKNGFLLMEKMRKKIWWEWNFILEVTLKVT